MMLTCLGRCECDYSHKNSQRNNNSLHSEIYKKILLQFTRHRLFWVHFK